QPHRSVQPVVSSEARILPQPVSVSTVFSFSVSVLSTQTTIRQSLKKRNDEPKNHLIQHLTTCSIDLP
ncbi:hypothetical protein, partial [Marinobacterium iners]|uniref:hypothetical protein n=1 Tax=Marinobacterium iners TaxID=48076 RepID=UPI001C31B123